MIQVLKNLIRENRAQQNKIILQTKELEWAFVYHDSIRGRKFIEELPLNVGRWACSYAFLYVLNRILYDFKPKSILELGLGETTKVISTYIDQYLTDSSHVVIEQDENWKNQFEERFTISPRTHIKICPPEKIDIKGFDTTVYQELDTKVSEKFDIYVVDGPNGSVHFSRYDIVWLASKFTPADQFIILIDDYNRAGEKETVIDLRKVFVEQKIPVFEGIYEGNKTLLVIATEEFKYAASL